MQVAMKHRVRSLRVAVAAGLAGAGMVAVSTGPAAAAPGDTSVVIWGDDAAGALEVPDGPGEALDGADVTAVAGGANHVLALTSTGKVVGWGSNAVGGNQADVPDGPGEALDGKTVTSIAAGVYHSVVATSDGRVVAWGYNNTGQSNVPDGPGQALDGVTVTAVAAGLGHTLALTSTGRVIGWGNDGNGQADAPDGPGEPLDGVTVTAIAANNAHSLALTSTGRVVAWGLDGDHQTDVPDGPGEPLENATVTAVSAGYFHSMALTSTGKVVAWGSNFQGQLDVPDGPGEALDGETVTAIAAGGYHSLALTSTGKVVAWGNNSLGQTDVPVGPGQPLDGAEALAIAGGANFSVAIAVPSVITGLTPTINGVAQQGQTLTADAGPVVPVDADLAYQWLSDGIEIPGATSSTYKVTKADVGKQLSVRITATRTGYVEAVEESDPTVPVHKKYNRAELQLSKTSAKRGQTVSVDGFGFTPGNTYTVRYNASILGTGGTVVATVTADQYGELSVPLTIPNGSPSGPVTITVSGTNPALMITTITVTNG